MGIPGNPGYQATASRRSPRSTSRPPTRIRPTGSGMPCSPTGARRADAAVSPTAPEAPGRSPRGPTPPPGAEDRESADRAMKAISGEPEGSTSLRSRPPSPGAGHPGTFHLVVRPCAPRVSPCVQGLDRYRRATIAGATDESRRFEIRPGSGSPACAAPLLPSPRRLRASLGGERVAPWGRCQDGRLRTAKFQGRPPFDSEGPEPGMAGARGAPGRARASLGSHSQRRSHPKRSRPGAPELPA